MCPFDNLIMPIDFIYEKLLENIKNDGRTKDISQEFLSMTEPYKRVFYVYKLIKSYNLIPLVHKEDKCEFSSIHYRNLGNKAYKQSHYHTAWQYYNLALMYAPLDSECYAISVSNRSAVFASLKKYKECLKDIEMVFTLEYPDSIKDKLIKRQEMCEEALQKAENPDIIEEDKDIKDIFTFKGTKNEKYVDASSKLRVKYTPEMGRHVIADQDIEVGEILVQEDPYVSVLLRDQIMYTCANCFSRKCNLYPCPYCCMSMYCSRECAKEAWEQYHSYECPLLAFLLNISNFTKLELLALRATIKTRTDQKQWYHVIQSVKTAEACENPENLGCKETDEGKLVYSSKNFESVHTLATNIEKRDVSDIFQKAVSAAVLLHILAVKNFMECNDPEQKQSTKIFTANTLMRHLMTAPTNMHGITANVEDGDGNYVDEINIGSGAYPFLSLINHSCAPNVVRFTRLGMRQVTLFALRPIKKGQQIFDNYGYFEMLRDDEELSSECIMLILPIEGFVRAEIDPRSGTPKKAHHAVHTKVARQAILRSQYKFTCICEACTDDFPLYKNLKTIPNLPVDIVASIMDNLNGDVIEVLQKANRRRAQELFKPLCKLATALEPYIPCKEAAECQEALKQCLSILSGVLVNGFSKCVEFTVPAPRESGAPTPTKFYVGNSANDLYEEF